MAKHNFPKQQQVLYLDYPRMAKPSQYQLVLYIRTKSSTMTVNRSDEMP